jgi:hypothetical protein
MGQNMRQPLSLTLETTYNTPTNKYTHMRYAVLL